MRVARKLKSERHHWWPKALSQFWAAEDGYCTQLPWNGEEVRLEPGKFGSIKNAHHIKHGEDSPWNTTFEPMFNETDASFPHLVAWLLALNTRAAPLANAAAPVPALSHAAHLCRRQRTPIGLGGCLQHPSDEESAVPA